MHACLPACAPHVHPVPSEVARGRTLRFSGTTLTDGCESPPSPKQWQGFVFAGHRRRHLRVGGASWPPGVPREPPGDRGNSRYVKNFNPGSRPWFQSSLPNPCCLWHPESALKSWMVFGYLQDISLSRRTLAMVSKLMQSGLHPPIHPHPTLPFS